MELDRDDTNADLDEGPTDDDMPTFRDDMAAAMWANRILDQ